MELCDFCICFTGAAYIAKLYKLFGVLTGSVKIVKGHIAVHRHSLRERFLLFKGDYLLNISYKILLKADLVHALPLKHSELAGEIVRINVKVAGIQLL